MTTRSDKVNSIMSSLVSKLALATQTSAGRMSAADKKKLDELPTRAELDSMLTDFETDDIVFLKSDFNL